MIQFTYELKLNERVRAKRSRHFHYDIGTSEFFAKYIASPIDIR
jgi:hypothetical protein